MAKSRTGNLLRQLFNWKRGTKASRPKADSFSDPTGVQDTYYLKMRYARSRHEQYDVYDEMDQMSNVASVLDAYAEDATPFNKDREATIWIEGSDKRTIQVVKDLLERLGVEDLILGLARDLGKYGDDFGIIRTEGKQINTIEWRDPRDIERVEDRDGVLLGFEERKKLETQSEFKKEELTYKPWDVAHFRLYKTKRLRKQKHRNIYGTSVLHAAEQISKQLKMLDDILMIYRLTRSFDKRVFYVDVGRSAPQDTIQILKKWKNALKKNPYINPTGNRYDSQWDPQSASEDIFWPTTPNSNSRVETIPGQGNVGDIADIQYFRDQFFGAVRAPKAYFGFDGDINSKSTLGNQDMKWGRAVNALQRSILQGFTRLGQIQLALLGMDTSTDNFKLRILPASVLEELQRIEATAARADIAERMMGMVETFSLDAEKWRDHVLSKYMGYSTAEIRKYTKKIEEEPPPEPPQKEPEKGPPPSPTGLLDQPEKPKPKPKKESYESGPISLLEALAGGNGGRPEDDALDFSDLEVH